MRNLNSTGLKSGCWKIALVSCLAATFCLLQAAKADGPGESSVTIALDGLSLIQASGTSPFAVGDGVNSSDLSAPRSRCVEYGADDVKSDTQGAITSHLRASLVRNLDDLSTKINFSYSIAAIANVKAAILSGESSVKNTGKLETFFQRQRQSLMVVVDVTANHGRDMINNYTLKKEFGDLISQQKYAEFIKQCGTHFIRGLNKKSVLRVTFNFTNLDEKSRNFLETKWDSEAKGDMTIDAISAGGKSTMSASLSVELTSATQLGTMSIDVDATGGQGVATLGQILAGFKVSNVTDVEKLISGMTTAAADFTRTNAAPDQFILIPYPQLPTVAEFDSRRFDALGAIYKKLLRVDSALDEYKSYQTQSPTLWEKYFRVYQEKLTALRAKLVSTYQTCRMGQNCETDVPDSIDGIFLSDIIFDGELYSLCPRSSIVDLKINDISNSKASIVSTIYLIYKGKIRFLDELDVLATEAYRVTPDLKRENLQFVPKDQFRYKVTADNSPSDVYSVPYSLIVDYRPFVSNGQIDYAGLNNLRAYVARSIYLFKFSFVNGRSFEQILGPPNMKGCALVEE